MKLSDTQLVILQSGARNADRLCLADAKLGAAPRHAIAKKLVSLGLAEAAPCPPTVPPAHRFPSSAKAGAKPMTLRITDAGLRAIGIEPEEQAEDPPILTMTDEERTEAAEAEAVLRECGQDDGMAGLTTSAEEMIARDIEAAEAAENAAAAEAAANAPRAADPATDGILAAKAEARARAERKASERAAKQAARAEDYARRAAEADAEARSGRGFWRAAEEAVARSELPPAPDFSAPTHAPYRKKLQRLIELAQAGDAAGLRAVQINPTSTSPKTLIRWRDLAVRAIEARGRA